jgi:prepilin-type N-terminal cleavage/methylation domain-containing protein
MRTINSRGYSMVEIAVALSVLSILTLATSNLMMNLFSLQSTNRAKAALQDVKTEIAYSLQKPSLCPQFFGTATPPTINLANGFDPVTGGPIDLYRQDGTTIFLRGAPAAGQNMLESGARISSIRLVPIANAPSPDARFNYLVARIVLEATVRQPGTTAESAVATTPIPVILKLRAVAPNIDRLEGCSRDNPDATQPIPLPTCTTNQRLVFTGTPPEWQCRTL